jgi:hypothetical protein
LKTEPILNPPKVTHPIDQPHVTYLLLEEEVWARSYAQYIALRSGDATMQPQVADIRRRPIYGARHWEDADFEQVADAIDALFEGLGWRTR